MIHLTLPIQTAFITSLCYFLIILHPFALAQSVLSQNTSYALERGIYEVTLNASPTEDNPYYDIQCTVTFSKPDGTKVKVNGFFDGGSSFKARAYCEQPGQWQWQSASNNQGLDSQEGRFEVLPSDLKGKLRIHPEDPHQFAYDNGDWFLHIGDTGYRFVVASEPHWQAYIDQASEMGATKVRTWFAMDRGKVNSLFTHNGRDLSLFYWKEIETRILYTLEHHPHMVLQLIPYAEDTDLINKYSEGNAASLLVARSAQARWSSFPNIQWTITNDRQISRSDTLSGREVHYETINAMGRDMSEREAWGTLLTNHQSRFKGYDHINEAWSDIITLEDLDQVAGELILEYRQKREQPVVLDEDRYELYRYAVHRRYYFRRLMWASLLSGGHATYGGLNTHEPYGGQHYEGHDSHMKIAYQPYEGEYKGVSGYFDANRKGILSQGAHDFRHIHAFYKETGLTMVNMQPDDILVGNDPYLWKCAHNDSTYIIYLANPSGAEPGKDYPQLKPPSVSLNLTKGIYDIRWFDPDTGSWVYGSKSKGGNLSLTAPGPEDWVLLIKKQR
ncbi:DUF5060 domain-containing protein [Catalinimonas niigatensis]|uniref:DUF5060 domain-containing protein n=1 Tax=Catalinimonas niigatensis TaxID=1397264 RepID=UPI002665B85E|nr:DUF5060 domain-containing protein [Catalinimonas niigatensis]WPP50605.1 DUF5060 domain-containing protein [Catalinimonas niigatensis]